MADDKQKDSALKPIATIKKTVIAADKKEATKTEVKAETKKAATKKATTKKATAKKAPAKKAEAKTETKKETATKPAAKTETKAAAKKPAAKKAAAKPAAKKAPAKKETAAKSTVKPSIFLQYGGNDVAYDTLVQNAKNVFQYDMGGKVSDIKDLAVYVKPEEGKAYFVINGSIEGNFNL